MSYLKMDTQIEHNLLYLEIRQVELDEYELGIIYVYTDDKSLIKNKDDIFKYIPDKCEQNIVYTKNPKPIEIKVKPAMYEKGEQND